MPLMVFHATQRTSPPCPRVRRPSPACPHARRTCSGGCMPQWPRPSGHKPLRLHLGSCSVAVRPLNLGAKLHVGTVGPWEWEGVGRSHYFWLHLITDLCESRFLGVSPREPFYLTTFCRKQLQTALKGGKEALPNEGLDGKIKRTRLRIKATVY